MRSSNYKHLKNNSTKSTDRKNSKPENKVKKYSKIGSLILTAFIVLSAIVIPSISLVQNVAAVSDGQKPTISVGDTEVLSNAIVAETEKKEAKVKKTKATEETVAQTTEPVTTEATEPETEEVTDAPETEPETEAETEAVTEAAASTVSGTHIELSDYERTLLEGLVMGEAGGNGYDCCALVAQAVHDSMVESGTTSVESIIGTYGYDASTNNTPSSAVKSAVSYIFDSDGRAVDHRILYFYSSDMVSSDWHESQTFVTSSGNMRFFDRA